MLDNSAIIEAVNRSKLSALALGNNWMVYHPEADVGGVDLVIIHMETDELRKIQLKSRWTIDKKYEGKNIWVAFPYEKFWYMRRHDEMVELAHEFGYANTDSWKIKGTYNIPQMGKDLALKMDKWRFHE